MFKVAICISGHLRTFRKVAPFIFENLCTSETDFFIHTWDKMAWKNSWHKKDNEILNTLDFYKEIMETFMPKKIIIEKEESFISRLNIFEKNKIILNSMEPMWHKIKECNEIKKKYEDEKKFKYDFVVRMRSDLILKSKIKFDKFNNDNLYVSPCSHNKRTSDLFAIGSSEIIDNYSKAIDSMSVFLNENHENYKSESFLNWYLKRKNISTELLHGIYMNLLRIDNTKTYWKPTIKFL